MKGHAMALGPLMVGISGLTLTETEREILRHPLIGAEILFTRNYADVEHLQALTAEIHALREPALLIAVDHEGGRVQRFRQGLTVLPPVRELGHIYDRDARHAKHLAQLLGWLMAAELRAVGIDLSFAPVLDLDRGNSEVIGNRAFHSEGEVIAELAHAYMIGMDIAGMMATGYHFPGHGTAAAMSARPSCGATPCGKRRCRRWRNAADRMNSNWCEADALANEVEYSIWSFARRAAAPSLGDVSCM